MHMCITGKKTRSCAALGECIKLRPAFVWRVPQVPTGVTHALRDGDEADAEERNVPADVPVGSGGQIRVVGPR